MSPLWLALALSCKDKRDTTVTVDFPFMEPPPEEAPPAGTISDGRFVDEAHGLSINVPPDWEPTLGSERDALRLRLHSPPTGAVVELWAFNTVLSEPAPRPECTWRFQDHGPYTSIPSDDLLMVSTCTPDDAGENRVMAWLIAENNITWQIELHTPSSNFSEAHQAGMALLHTMQF